VYYYLAAQLVKKTKNDITYPVLTRICIQKYITATAPSIVVADYTSPMTSRVNNPIIVAKCDIQTDSERLILERSLNATEVTFDTIMSYRKYFNNGFIISSKTTDPSVIKEYLPINLHTTVANVLWRANIVD
jgi:hypothetical protein